MKDNVIEKLSELATSLANSHKDLNLGGCGVVASLMYDKLKDVSNKVEILFNDRNLPENSETLIEYRYLEFKNNSKFNTLANLNEYNLSCSHAVVRFAIGREFYIFDTDVGVVLSGEFMEKSLGAFYVVPPETVKEMASSPDGWNTYFDRRQIPALSKQIEDFELGG